MDALLGMEISCATLVRAEPRQVYDAFATAEGLDGWFTAGAAVDARPGGEIRFRWRGWGPDRLDQDDGGPVLEARPGERLVFQWHPDGPDYATTVELSFEPVAEGTVVRLREHGFRDTPGGRRAFVACATGWGEALTLARFWVEQGRR